MKTVKTVLLANALLAVFVVLLMTYPLLAAAYLAALLYASRHRRKLRRLWLNYYRYILTLEYRLSH